MLRFKYALAISLLLSVMITAGTGIAQVGTKASLHKLFSLPLLTSNNVPRAILRLRQAAALRPLCQAVALGQVQATRHFLAAGANAREKDSNGKTPYEISLAHTHMTASEISRMEVENLYPWLDDKIRDNYVLNAILLRATVGINGIDQKGSTPLHWAIASENEEEIRKLIRDGADVLGGHYQSALDVAEALESEAMLNRIVDEELSYSKKRRSKWRRIFRVN